MDTEDRSEDDEEEFDDEDCDDEGSDDEDVVVEDKPTIDNATALLFDPLEVKLQSFYKELSLISSKKPDSPINSFKLRFVNQTLQNANALIGEAYLPFPDFRVFEDSNLPSASDVVMILAQYLKCMQRFYFDHTFMKDSQRWWRTIGGENPRASRTTIGRVN